MNVSTSNGAPTRTRLQRATAPKRARASAGLRSTGREPPRPALSPRRRRAGRRAAHWSGWLGVLDDPRHLVVSPARAVKSATLITSAARLATRAAPFGLADDPRHLGVRLATIEAGGAFGAIRPSQIVRLVNRQTAAATSARREAPRATRTGRSHRSPCCLDVTQSRTASNICRPDRRAAGSAPEMPGRGVTWGPWPLPGQLAGHVVRRARPDSDESAPRAAGGGAGRATPAARRGRPPARAPRHGTTRRCAPPREVPPGSAGTAGRDHESLRCECSHRACSGLRTLGDRIVPMSEPARTVGRERLAQRLLQAPLQEAGVDSAGPPAANGRRADLPIGYPRRRPDDAASSRAASEPGVLNSTPGRARDQALSSRTARSPLEVSSRSGTRFMVQLQAARGARVVIAS